MRVRFVCVFFVQKESLCRWEIFFFRNRNPLDKNRHTNTHWMRWKQGSPTTTKHTTEHHQIHTHTHIHTRLCGKSLYLSSRILSLWKSLKRLSEFYFLVFLRHTQSEWVSEREREKDKNTSVLVGSLASNWTWTGHTETGRKNPGGEPMRAAFLSLSGGIRSLLFYIFSSYGGTTQTRCSQGIGEGRRRRGNRPTDGTLGLVGSLLLYVPKVFLVFLILNWP